MQDYKRNIDGFINEDEAIVKTEPKTIDYETSTVSLGNDNEDLLKEKNKPKDEQDKDKIKQLEKSIKDREKHIKKQVKNNKKYKPNSNAWEGVIDEKNDDDWSYIANNWKEIPEEKAFKRAAQDRIDESVMNFSKDREWSLNLPNQGFDEWNSYQENPDDPNNYERFYKEKEDWNRKLKDAVERYLPSNYDYDGVSPTTGIALAYREAVRKGDYDAATILNSRYREMILDKSAKDYEKLQKVIKEDVKDAKEKAWEEYNSPNGTAKKLFEKLKLYGMDSDEVREEFLSKNPNPSQNAKNAFRDVYKSELVESKIITGKEPTKETKSNENQQTQNFKVGQAPRKVLNEAQSETSKNIKDTLLDETYQTLTADEKRDALKNATERALNKYSSSFIDKANTRENAAQLSKFLPRFAIQHFLEGNFGDKKDPRSWGTLGYFLLDKVGKSLVNASQVARGFSPTEKTALENYNETMMKNAFGRDDENRRKILNSSLDTLVKDSDVLREVGISDFKIFDDFTEKVLTQYQDNIQNVNLDKILKEKSDFILNMPEDEQQKFIGYLIAMDVSEPGSAAYLNSAYRAADLELRYAKTDAEKYAAQKSKSEIDLKLAGLDVNNKLLFGQLDSLKLKNEKDRATMTAEIDRVIRENEKLIEDIKMARTNNEFLAREKEAELNKKIAEVVSAYADAGSNVVGAVGDIIDAIIPG